MAKRAHDVAGIVDREPTQPHHGQIVRNSKSGRFEPGTTGGAGRPKGSRNALSSQLIEDVFVVWAEKGLECLRQLAEIDPGKFAALAIALVPKEAKVEQNITVGRALDALQAFRLLQSLPKAQLIELKNAAADADD
jgi:hypothetical protein